MARNNRRRREHLRLIPRRPPSPKPFKPRPDHPRCPKTGKLRYSSLEAAENMLKEIVLHGAANQLACRSYSCPHCGGYHHTSRPRFGSGDAA